MRTTTIHHYFIAGNVHIPTLGELLLHASRTVCHYTSLPVASTAR